MEQEEGKEGVSNNLHIFTHSVINMLTHYLVPSLIPEPAGGKGIDQLCVTQFNILPGENSTMPREQQKEVAKGSRKWRKSQILLMRSSSRLEARGPTVAGEYWGAACKQEKEGSRTARRCWGSLLAEAIIGVLCWDSSRC